LEAKLDQLCEKPKEAGLDEDQFVKKADVDLLIQNIKTKHQAEIDAMAIEQGILKKIIKELIGKMKRQQKEL